eukprot:scaffold5537_cov112-Isochrysis_galbana.AAC.2
MMASDRREFSKPHPTATDTTLRPTPTPSPIRAPTLSTQHLICCTSRCRVAINLSQISCLSCSCRCRARSRPRRGAPRVPRRLRSSRALEPSERFSQRAGALPFGVLRGMLLHCSRIARLLFARPQRERVSNSIRKSCHLSIRSGINPAPLKKNPEPELEPVCTSPAVRLEVWVPCVCAVATWRLAFSPVAQLRAARPLDRLELRREWTYDDSRPEMPFLKRSRSATCCDSSSALTLW